MMSDGEHWYAFTLTTNDGKSLVIWRCTLLAAIEKMVKYLGSHGVCGWMIDCADDLIKELYEHEQNSDDSILNQSIDYSGCCCKHPARGKLIMQEEWYVDDDNSIHFNVAKTYETKSINDFTKTVKCIKRDD